MSNYINNHEWEYNGDKYKTGNSLNEPLEDNNIYPIVWFKKKLYKVNIIKPEWRNRPDRVCLIDIYDSNKKPYWTTVDKVFQITKLN